MTGNRYRITKLRLVLIMAVVALTTYDYLIFFAPKSKKGIEPPVVKYEELIKVSFHESGWEDALIQDVSHKDFLVLVTTYDTKISITFRPLPKDMKRFREGSLSGITFECGKRPGEKCDLSQPYKLYANNAEVELIKIEQQAVR